MMDVLDFCSGLNPVVGGEQISAGGPAMMGGALEFLEEQATICSVHYSGRHDGVTLHARQDHTVGSFAACSISIRN